MSIGKVFLNQGSFRFLLQLTYLFFFFRYHTMVKNLQAQAVTNIENVPLLNRSVF